MTRISALLLGVLLTGCAYYENGAASRIRLNRNGNEAAYLNGRRLNDTVHEFEISNHGAYRIRLENESGNREDTVATAVNPDFFQNVIMWPYFFVDYNLGSHLVVRDGKEYRVMNRGRIIQDECEERAREGLKRSVRNTFLFFLGGNLFALAGAAYAPEPEKSLAIRVPLSIGAMAGLVGMGYNGYNTAKRTREIHHCIDERNGRQEIYD